MIRSLLSRVYKVKHLYLLPVNLCSGKAIFTGMRRFAHIINPVNKPPGSELARVQPVTFASIERALREAKGKADVTVYSAQYPEDHPVIPSWMVKTPDLERSLMDFGTFQRPRKLPVMKDVLDRLYAASDAEYFIFSNADICLMPSFYELVNHYADKGYDAFAINRRRITDRFDKPEELELMYAEAGRRHPGYDTLVFKRSLYPKFTLGEVCVGIPFFDTVLIHNFYTHAENFRLFTGKHLTFHIGMELCKEWGDPDHYRHNAKEYAAVRKTLYPQFKIENFPGANLPFFKRHFKWLMNPTFHYPTMLKLDLSQLSHKRRPRNGGRKKTFGEKYCEFFVEKVNFEDEF